MSEDIEPVATQDRQATRPPGSAVHKTRRQRRPTGAPPPLPHPVTITTTAWLVLGAVVLAGAFVATQQTPWLRIDDRASAWVLRQLAGMRTPWLTDVANGINVAGSGWGATVLGLSVVALSAARVATSASRPAEQSGAALPDGMDRSLRNVRRNVRDSRTGIWSARHRR